MIKKIFLFLLLFSSKSLIFSAAPPEILRSTGIQIERKTLVWKVASLKPLSETLSAKNSENGWRMELERPLESRTKDGIQEPLKPGDQRNTAELVFIPQNENIEKIRGQLSWLSEPGELYTRVIYLGQKWQYSIFIRGDIATVSSIRNLIQPTGGDDLNPIYAEALNMLDYDDITRRAAANLIVAGGNDVIPLINQSIGIALSKEIDTSPHFLALKGIGTPEAASAFASALKSGQPDIVKNAAAALVLPPALKGAESLYLAILKDRNHLAETLACLESLGCQKDALPIIRKLQKNPDTFYQFAELVFSEYRFQSGAKTVPELQLSEQIRLLLARVGDIPGTPKYISVADKAAEKEAELIVAERKRITPLEQQFIKSENTDCAICSAILLCVFNPTTRSYSEAYVKRINAEGIRLLKSLPRNRVRQILRLLRENVESQKESDFFGKLLIQVG